MNKGKSKKKSVKKFKIGKYILIAILSIFLIASASLFGICIAVVKSAPDINSNIINSLKQSSKIYDMNGKYIEDYSGAEVRSVVSLNQIPTNLQNAFVSIEDERFYEHHGIDFKRIIGALWIDIKTRSKAQGASTITQQLAKNAFLTQEKKITRKIQEAYIAIQLERKLTKDQILEAYLNTIYLGGNSYGVEASAMNYFSKDVKDLTLGESAFLAGLNKNPLKYYPYSKINKIPTELGAQYYELSSGEIKKIPDPDNATKNLPAGAKIRENINYTNLKEIPTDPKTIDPVTGNPKPIDDKYSLLYYRRNIVLEKMYELGKITKEQYEAARLEKFHFTSKENNVSMKYQWFIEPAIDSIAQDFANKYGIGKNEAKQRLRVGGYNIYLTINTKIQDAAQKVINNANNYKGVRIPKSIKMYTTEKKSSNSNENPVKYVQPQAAAVIYDYTAGQMRAIVGGRGPHPRLSINRATMVPRQPGSSIKPLAVYGPAIDSKLATAGTVILDSPMSPEFIASHGGWNPHNYETHSFTGRVTIRKAIQKSINIVSIKLLDMLGTNTSLDYLQNKFYISTLKTTGPTNDNGLAPLGLGALTEGVYPYEMAAAYGVFGNNGIYSSPIMYTKITDNMGNTILEKSSTQTQSISPQAAYIMVDMLKGVVRGGTGTRANIGKMPAAGKTGTAADNTNLWFCGLTPYYSGAIWLGHDMPKVPLSGLSSGTAASMWGKIMKVANSNLPVKDFSRPSGIVTAQICNLSGKAPSDSCPKSNVVSEIFTDGTQPVEICDIHKSPKVDITTNSSVNIGNDQETNTDDNNTIEDNTNTIPSTNDNNTPSPDTTTTNDKSNIP